MIYIGNAFSLGMLDPEKPEHKIYVVKLTLDEARNLVETRNYQSVIGHASTAEVLSRLLGVEVPMNRVNLRLKEGDSLLVFQLTSRLPEGRILTDEELAQLSYIFYLVQT